MLEAEFLFICRLGQSKSQKCKDVHILHSTGPTTTEYELAYSVLKAVPGYIWHTIRKLEAGVSTNHLPSASSPCKLKQDQRGRFHTIVALHHSCTSMPQISGTLASDPIKITDKTIRWYLLSLGLQFLTDVAFPLPYTHCQQSGLASESAP